MDFYYHAGSPPCRSTFMVAKSLGLELNLKYMNLLTGDHLKPEFVAINPEHTIPTIDDNGFVLWESRAIMGYLADTYGKDDSLYPKDTKKRAVVNQRLYFDIGVLYQCFSEYFWPQVMQKVSADPEKLKKVEEALGFLNIYLEGQTYVTGEKLTIADLSIFSTLSTYTLADEIDFNPYPNVQKWYTHLEKTAPGREFNKKGIDDLKQWLSEAKK
ncbi:GstD1.2 family protein [Megaselia abdita]